VVDFVVAVQLVRIVEAVQVCREALLVVKLPCTFQLLNLALLIRNFHFDEIILLKISFSSLKKEFSLVNLGRIQNLIDAGRLDPSKPITLKSLFDAGIENLQDGIKILASVIEQVF
jgi:hypothetical protein